MLQRVNQGAVRGEWQNAREKGYTPSRATTCLTPTGGATQIGSKRAFPIKLIDGLTSSRVKTDLRRPRSHQRTRTATQPHFHVNGWAEGPWELIAKNRDELGRSADLPSFARPGRARRPSLHGYHGYR